jgi:ubiquinone/menaquinone biosynthesis C-methylase UbiE
VEKLDILHIDDSNPRATLVADLIKPNDLPSSRFDCIICTHVLHAIADLDRAIAELYRILKSGGVLLVAVPQVSMCDPRYQELWRFTAEGLALILSKAFGKENVIVEAYGNSLTAAGEIRGMVAHEFSEATLNYHDPRFAVEVCARARKLL